MLFFTLQKELYACATQTLPAAVIRYNFCIFCSEKQHLTPDLCIYHQKCYENVQKVNMSLRIRVMTVMSYLLCEVALKKQCSKILVVRLSRTTKICTGHALSVRRTTKDIQPKVTFQHVSLFKHLITSRLFFLDKSMSI